MAEADSLWPQQGRQQAVTGLLAIVEHLLKTLGATVVRVRHDLAAAVRRILHEERQFVPMLWRTLRAQARQIVMIHGQNVIEVGKITRRYLACALGGEVIAALPGMLLAARIGRFACMPAIGPGGINMELVSQRMALRTLAQYALGGGRAANIAHANEENGDFGGGSHDGRCGRLLFRCRKVCLLVAGCQVRAMRIARRATGTGAPQ